jgi:hypothetical protein
MTTKHSVYIGGIQIEVSIERHDGKDYLDLSTDASLLDTPDNRAGMKRIVDALRAAQTDDEQEYDKERARIAAAREALSRSRVASRRVRHG